MLEKSTFVLFFILLSSLAKAQADEAPGEFKNEFGVDITGAIRFFTQFQSSGDYNYSPQYYLTYRRLMKPGNIRFGIGGDYDNFESPGAVGDPATYSYNFRSLDLRLGWEFKSSLTPKWEVFYGLDVRTSYTRLNDEALFFNAGYAVGADAKSNIIGLAPLLGFRFKINDRMSLLTEVSLSINSMKQDVKNTYIPLAGFGEKEDEVAPTTNSVFMSFSQPVSIFLVFNI